MTTIAFDNNTVAADGRCCLGDTIMCDDRVKIRKSLGYVFAVTGLGGPDSWLEQWMEWYFEGCNPENTPWSCSKGAEHVGGALIVMERKGSIAAAFRYDFQFPFGLLLPLGAAFGSGSAFAEGAMMAGASATRAVEIACKFDIHSGGKITTLEL